MSSERTNGYSIGPWNSEGSQLASGRYLRIPQDEAIRSIYLCIWRWILVQKYLFRELEVVIVQHSESHRIQFQR